MITTKLYDLIYDKLANNTDNQMFQPEMADDMEIIYDADTHEAEYIMIKIKDREYYLTIKEGETSNRLDYLLEKEKVCPLDKDEKWELEKLTTQGE